jgi:integrase
MKSVDPAAFRVKPMPIQVLHHAQSRCDPTNEIHQLLMDAAYIGFFWLLRPGEYLRARNSKPICLRNVTLRATATQTPFQALNAPLAEIIAADFSAITFDDQKNRTKGEVIAHGSTDHHLACPTKAIIRRVLYLRQHDAPADTPLLSTWADGAWRTVPVDQVTRLLRRSAECLPDLNYEARDVTARSLRHGGAMALLLGGTDKDTIKLVGRWRSDAIFRYLHAQALPLVAPLANTMLRHGNFQLMPGGLTPAEAERLLQAHPVEPGQAFHIETPPDEGDVDEDIDDDLLLAEAVLRAPPAFPVVAF